MRVVDAMTVNASSCNGWTCLASVAGLLWDADIGAVPVVDEDGKVVGIITDRDMCIAMGTRDRASSQIRVYEVMTTPALTCLATDDVKTALQTMDGAQIRRLPVVNESGQLCGIVTLNDIMFHAERTNDPALTAEVMKAMCRVCAPRHGERAATAIA